MTQSTSVNANGSLSLLREGSSAWPSGAFTITFRDRVSAWTGANWQTLLGLRLADGGSSKEALIAARLDVGELRAYAENYDDGLGMYGQRTFASGSPTDWLSLAVSWDGVSSGADMTVTVEGGSPVTHAVSGAKIYRLDVFTDVYAEQANQARGCGLFVFDGLLTSGEIAAQLASDTPITPGSATLWSWYPMDDASTAHVDASGNGRNLTPTGTGVTVSDVPYDAAAPIEADVGQADEADAATSITASKQATTGLAAETASAIAPTTAKRAAVGVAIESSAALAVTASKSVTVGLSAETDAAIAQGIATQVTVGVAVETSAALGLTAAKRRAMGRANETDIAVSLAAPAIAYKFSARLSTPKLRASVSCPRLVATLASH